MCFRLSFASTLMSLLLTAAIPAFTQVAPSANKGGWPLVVGAGFSDYNIDWGMGRREDGATLYADWTFRKMPRLLYGLGVEAEARHLTFDPPADISFFQYQTVGGGAI